MESNEIVREQIFQIIENQRNSDDPKETNLTYKRLVDMGYTDYETKQLIGQCVAVEIYDVFTNRKPFDKDRYVRNLNKLPQEPFNLET